MSGPSILHEDRVVVLRDLADLSGYVVTSQLAANPRPDLVRLHRSVPAILVADAKATETPGNLETQVRLLGYVGAVAPWLQVEFAVRIALCHGPDPHRRWVTTLEKLADLAGVSIVRHDMSEIDHDTSVSVVDVGPKA